MGGEEKVCFVLAGGKKMFALGQVGVNVSFCAWEEKKVCSERKTIAPPPGIKWSAPNLYVCSGDLRKEDERHESRTILIGDTCNLHKFA